MTVTTLGLVARHLSLGCSLKPGLDFPSHLFFHFFFPYSISMCYRGNLLRKVAISDLPCQGRVITTSDNFGAGQDDAMAARMSALTWCLLPLVPGHFSASMEYAETKSCSYSAPSLKSCPKLWRRTSWPSEQTAWLPPTAACHLEWQKPSNSSMTLQQHSHLPTCLWPVLNSSNGISPTCHSLLPNMPLHQICHENCNLPRAVYI